MCVGGGGRAARSGSMLRANAGRAVQRQSAQRRNLGTRDKPFDSNRLGRLNDALRKAGAPTIDHVKNPEYQNQNRVAIRDEASARRKSRGIRSRMQEESNYRSSRSSRRKGSGLRIGGSGVSVPGIT